MNIRWITSHQGGRDNAHSYHHAFDGFARHQRRGGRFTPTESAIVRGDADEHVIRDADFVAGHDDRLLHGQRTAIGSILLMITAA